MTGNMTRFSDANYRTLITVIFFFCFHNKFYNQKILHVLQAVQVACFTLSFEPVNKFLDLMSSTNLVDSSVLNMKGSIKGRK